MAVPRHRQSNARKNSRRAHWAKMKKNPIRCTNCGTMILPHIACNSCGWYNNREVIEVKEKEAQSE